MPLGRRSRDLLPRLPTTSTMRDLMGEESSDRARSCRSRAKADFPSTSERALVDRLDQAAQKLTLECLVAREDPVVDGGDLAREKQRRR